MDREEEMALLRKQMEEMQRALSHPEVQQLLHTLDKGKEKKGLESGEIPQDSARKEPQIVEQSQREAQAGLSQKHDKQNEDNQRPESPQFLFMKDLDNIVPEQDMNLEPEREEAKNGEVQSKRRIPVDDKSKHIHKKHQKKKTFKAGDKDVKFEAYNGRRNNDKALAFIRQFEVAFAEGNFKERSKLHHVGMYLKGTASSWWLTQILEGKKPKDWSAFKKAFYSQFLFSDFEQEVRKEWDRLSQWEDAGLFPDIMPRRPNPLWAEHTNVLRVVNTSGQAGSGTRTWVCKYCGEQMTSTITRVLKHLTGIGTIGHCGGYEAVPPALRDALILEYFPPGSTASSQSGGARAAAIAAKDALQDALLGDIGGSASALPSFAGTSRKRARVSQAEDEGTSASAASTGIGREVVEENYLQVLIERWQEMLSAVWATHGDDISIQYSGTQALKGDFVRYGKRTLVGFLQDGFNALARYYLNNFQDGSKQDALDLISGQYVVSRCKPSPFLLNGFEAFAYLPIASALIIAGLTYTTSSIWRVGEDAYHFITSALWAGFTAGLAALVRANGQQFCSRPRLCGLI
ncbi:hypothetical protein L7F22_040186 [Adiantum nelumboides]|nr:hypothetical protein [Adiantum nelumboides]